MKKQNAVIFDMDGVLFDTERVCEASWVAVAKKHGLPGMKEIFPKCIGRNENDSKNIVLAAYGEDFDYAAFRKETGEWFWNYIEEKGLPVMPGVRELLNWLAEENWKIGLASSTKQSSVLQHLEQAQIRDYFSIIVTGDMVEHSKPEPDIYLKACTALGTKPAETYAIEDSPNGIRSACRAGMMPVMVPDMIAPDAEMRELSRKICGSLMEVLDFFRTIGE